MAKIAVLGAGNVGCATAADLTLRGYDVSMHSRSYHRIQPLIDVGGIKTVGLLGTNLARPVLTSDKLEDVVGGAEVVILCVPAMGHEYYGPRLAPLIQARQVLVVQSGHVGGALRLAKLLRDNGACRGISVCETSSSMYGCRLVGPACINVYVKAKRRLFGAFPAKGTDRLYAIMVELYPALVKASNVLETGFAYTNAMMHAPGTVLNAGWIEATKGDFRYYFEGISPSVATVIEAIDAERLKIAEALDIEAIPFLDTFYKAGYTTERAWHSGSIYMAFQESEVNRGRKAPASLEHRYMDEDVGYALVPLVSLAELAGVETPVMRSLVVLASVLRKLNFFEEGLTLSKFGMDGLAVSDLREFLYCGM